MIGAIDKILKFTTGQNKELFLSNELVKDACLMQFIVLGENAGRVSEKVRINFSEIEWKEISASRNYFAHVYHETIWDEVWNTIENYLPGLRLKIKYIIEILEKEDNAETN